MKKLISLIIALFVLASVGTLCVSAALPENCSFTPGRYGAEDTEACAPVGDVHIIWDPAVTQKIDLTDGDVTDWFASGYRQTFINPSNMVAWVGDHTDLVGWGITAWFVADPDYVYMAFDIYDPDFTYGEQNGYYNGDAIQLSIDYGGLIGETIEKDPDSMCSIKNIFYSFSCEEDGAPIRIMRQESDQDGWLSEANGDGVKGSARKTADGWSVEIAMSWQRLYDDYAWKAWLEDPSIYIGGLEKLPLKLGCCLYYLDRSETNGMVHWAAGTTNGIEDEAGTPCVSWTPYDNGLRLALPWEEGMQFNGGGIRIITVCETAVDVPCTEPVPEDTVEILPMPPEEVVTIPEETLLEETLPEETLLEETLSEQPDIQETAPKSELDAVMEKYGCSAFASGGVLTVLLLAAGAVCTRKKKDS